MGERRARQHSRWQGTRWQLGRVGAATAVLALVAVLAGLVVPAAWRAVGAEARASGEAGSLLTLLNRARTDNGLAPLASASDLTAIAADRAAAMARSGALAHTPDLGARACCWTWIAENVAYAGSVSSLHDVLMNSAPHRANILNADADDVGVAVVRADGTLWAAQVFRARSDAGRSADASGSSRDGERTDPSTGGSTGTSTGTTTDRTAYGAGTSPAARLSPAELAAIELRAQLQAARGHLRAERQRRGPLDPLRAAVRYAGTLDEVSG